MTTTRSRSGAQLHFPPSINLDGTGVIVPPPIEALSAIAADVTPKGLPLFVCGLMKSARRRRYNPRWAEMNRARVQLARLCLDRMLGEALDVPDEETEGIRRSSGYPRLSLFRLHAIRTR